MRPIEEGKEMNNGVDTSLFAGLEQLRSECLDEVRADTVARRRSNFMAKMKHLSVRVG